MEISLYKLGNRVAALCSVDNVVKYFDRSDVEIKYLVSTDKVAVNIQGYLSHSFSLAEVTIATVIPANFAEFETQLALLFNEVGSVTTTTLDLGDAPVYASNADALTGGLTSGQIYRTALVAVDGSSNICVVN